MATKPGSFIWMDSKFVPWNKASIHPTANTVQYGMGAFEGIRVNVGKKGSSIFRLHDHTDRLFQSAQILGMKIPYTKDDLNQAQIETVIKNNMPSVYIRSFIYYGNENLGLHEEFLKAHVMIAVWDFGTYLALSNPDEGLKLHVSSFTHAQVNSQMCNAKACGYYVNPILAIKEAKEAGCDDALMLDSQGCVAEASTSNVFSVKKGILYTPTDISILRGITRDTVFSIAKDLRLELVVKNISRDEMYIADEIFITGTALEIKAVSQVDGRKIGTGFRGPITKKIQNYYHKIVSGLIPKYSTWLTPIKLKK